MGLFNKKRNNNLPRRRLSESNNDQVSHSSIFKRNRTLTGTTSSNLDTISNSGDLESPRKHKHKLTIQRRKITSILLIVVLSIAAIFIIFNNFTASSSISVSDMTISKPINNSKYELAIKDYFDSNPITRFSFFQDESLITKHISNKLPEVLSVKRKSTFAGRTNFTLAMRIPVAGWQIDDKQYYVDADGVPFETNYYSNEVVQIVDSNSLDIQGGSGAIASHRFLSFVGRVVYFSKLNGYTVTRATLPLNTTRELDIQLKDINYHVKLSIDRPAGEQVEDMVRSIQHFTDRQNPKYIDVRVSNKAFYKY